MKHAILSFFIIIGGLSSAAFGEPRVAERVIMGWIEPVVLVPWGVQVKAKLDSGAKTSSIHAKNVERFEKDGEEWVRFTVPLETKRKKVELEVERPLVRDVRIKRHNDHAYDRPVIDLAFCMNGRDYTAQFNLIDRSGFNYPVLLGRRFLKDVAVIDPAATFLTRDDSGVCRKRHPQRTAKDKKTDHQPAR